MISKQKLHEQGPTLSKLVYGVWRLAEDPNGTSERVVQKKIETCLEIGITTFDHADIYGSYTCEEIFGKVLKQSKNLISQIQIVTKCGIMLVSPNRPQNKIKHYNTTKSHILQSVDTSLKNLGVEKIDLLLIHRPNPVLNPEEVALAFRELKEKGKVLFFGVSNFLAHQFETLQAFLDLPLVTNQIELHPLYLEYFLNGTLEQCLVKKIIPMIWSPFAGGRLLQKKDLTTIRVMEVVERLSKEFGFTPEEVLLKWVSFSPYNAIPIIGTNQIERIQRCANFEKVPMSNENWFEIYTAGLGKEVP
jgi:predicted oxidoreductase